MYKSTRSFEVGEFAPSQSVEENAFREMLRHAQVEKNCQIIITTSHERKTIGTYLEKIGVKHVAEFGTDRIIQKMP